MLLEHLSREKAEANRGRGPYAMISITDPCEPIAHLQDDSKRIAVLRLAFHDFTQEPEEFARLVAQADPPLPLDEGREWVLPSAAHAQAILRFYRSVAPKIQKPGVPASGSTRDDDD